MGMLSLPMFQSGQTLVIYHKNKFVSPKGVKSEPRLHLRTKLNTALEAALAQ